MINCSAPFYMERLFSPDMKSSTKTFVAQLLRDVITPQEFNKPPLRMITSSTNKKLLNYKGRETFMDILVLLLE